MIFYVAEDFLRYFISYRSAQRDEHGFGKRKGHELFHDRIVFAHKRYEILSLGTETESDCQFEKKADMEVAEIRLNGIEQKYVLFAPFEKSLFICSILDYTI